MTASASAQLTNNSQSEARRITAKLLTPDEARRIAINIGKLPELLSYPSDVGSGMHLVAARLYPRVRRSRSCYVGAKERKRALSDRQRRCEVQETKHHTSPSRPARPHDGLKRAQPDAGSDVVISWKGVLTGSPLHLSCLICLGLCLYRECAALRPCDWRKPRREHNTSRRPISGTSGPSILLSRFWRL